MGDIFKYYIIVKPIIDAFKALSRKSVGDADPIEIRPSYKGMKFGIRIWRIQ